MNFSSLDQRALSSKKFTCGALFDLDHTILNVNSSFCFGKFLYKRGHLSTPLMLKLALFYTVHKAGCISIKNLQNKIFNSLFKGRSYKFFVEQADQFIQKYLDEMCYQPVLNKLKEAQAQACFVAILSSAPDFLVSLIAKRLKVDYWEATSYAQKEGFFSHVSRHLLGEDKGLYAAMCAEKLQIDKAKMTAYTDSILDLPLLMAAGQKVAVRPDRALLKLSKKYNWKVI